MELSPAINIKRFMDCEAGELVLSRLKGSTVLCICSVFLARNGRFEKWAIALGKEEITREYIDESNDVASFGKDFEFLLSDFEVTDSHAPSIDVGVGDVLIASDGPRLVFARPMPGESGWPTLKLEDCTQQLTRSHTVITRSWAIRLPPRAGQAQPALYERQRKGI